MRVIFLDVDGVLNSAAFWQARSERSEGKLPKPEFWAARDSNYRGMSLSRFIDPSCVERLNRLLRESGAQVVMSSTWRTQSKTSTRDLLKRVGVRPAARLIGVTPRLERMEGRIYIATTRGAEIQAWLDWRQNIVPWLRPGGRGDVEQFAILDDDDDMAHLTPRLVQTDNRVGLTDADVDRALSMLAAPTNDTLDGARRVEQGTNDR